MNSKKIIEAVSRISSGLGYGFGTGTAYRALCDKSSERSVWLLPPTLSMVEGHRHGRATYSLTMHVTHRRLRTDTAQAVTLTDSMHDDVIELFRALYEEPFVALVDSLKIESKAVGLRPDGGIDLVVTAKVETIF